MSTPLCTGVPITSSPTAWRETIRFRAESEFADALATSGVFADAASGKWEAPNADRVRRRLLTTHIRLSDNMAPDVFGYARDAVAALCLETPLEIYQAAGDENAANWTCREVAFISLQGRLASLLDRECFLCLRKPSSSRISPAADRAPATSRMWTRSFPPS